jgi:hypothetical protein
LGLGFGGLGFGVGVWGFGVWGWGLGVWGLGSGCQCEPMSQTAPFGPSSSFSLSSLELSDTESL